mgnify:CR=1 FL=1
MEDYSADKVPLREKETIQTKERSEDDQPEPRSSRYLPGEEDELSEEESLWDGSEAEFVEDEDAAEYEEQQTGIKLSYQLRTEEVFSCLKRSGFCKTSGRRAVVETILLCAVGILFFVSFFFLSGGYNSLTLGILSFLLIGVIWLVPRQGMKMRARALADGKNIHVSIYPDEVVIGEGAGAWEIPLDGTSEIEEFDNMLVLFAKGDRMLCIPLRSIEPAVLPEVEAMLFAGSRPKEED